MVPELKSGFSLHIETINKNWSKWSAGTTGDEKVEGMYDD
jgi:hypothetical protein